MKKTIIVNRSLSDAEIREIKHLAEGGSSVFAFSGSNAPEFASRIIVNPEDKKEINYRILSDVLQFGDLQAGDQTIAGLFTIGKASIWHYHKFRIYFAVRNLMYFLEPLKRTFGTFENQIWYVNQEANILQKLFPEVEFRFTTVKAKAPFNFGNLFSYLVLVKLRILRCIFSARKHPEYLLYLTEKYSTVMDKHSLEPRQGHHILEYLISELDDRFALLTEVLMPKPKGKSDYIFSWKYLQPSWNDRPKIFSEGLFLSGLLSGKVRKSTSEGHHKIRSAYPKVQELNLSETHRLVFEVFHSLDKSTGFYLFRYFAACKYFKNSGIKAVIAPDENSPLTKSILDAAKYCGIKVIGLQHGTMHDLHPAYLFTTNDCKNRVMPDLTLTWGQYWQRFLVEKGNYPADSVIPVGQIRTDIIPELLNSEKQKKAQSIGIIVFASQPQRDPELRYQAARDVFKAAKRLPKSKLIVKLHPREFADADYYAAIAKEAKCTNYVFDTTSDLYQLIASCDALITCFSTVGTETVYFHKPLIILDHLKQDIQGYVAEGVAFHATDSLSLTSFLSGILSGNLKADHQKYDAFIQKYAFQIDGKVAERCIEAITSVK
jgi:CDP-glycerol glycerophosphotransferase (TagB/SpsB family)